ncbi:hypothetical protein AB0331_13605 [Dietzia maris]|uniref:hypothetical protein n=1 Tax=Dietzia maris TaxID=37915 RepID=UPI00344BA9F8
MSATIAVQSPRSPLRQQRPVAPRRSCQVNIDLFDPFNFRGGVLCDEEVRRARTAIAACHSCPLLMQCRAETAAVLDGTASRGVPPVGVVQAGILFDENSKPYGNAPAPVPAAKHTRAETAPMKGSRTKKSSAKTAVEQGMFDFADELSAAIHQVNGPEAAWVPDIDLSPPRINKRGVYFALGPEALAATVTRHRLKQTRRPFDPGTREILEPHDEFEVVRLGVERGMPLHRIAANLRTTWHRVDRMCGLLEITPTHKGSETAA